MHGFSRTLKTAARALRRNVMRSALTCLGIIIGVAAVIAIVEIGNGSATAIQKSISAMGANTLVIFPGMAASGGVSWGAGSVMTLTPQDCDALMAECPAVLDATPIVRTRSMQVVYGNRNWIPATIQGTSPEFFTIRDWKFVDGDSFTDRDVRNVTKVCVIGKTLVRELFQGQPAVGKDLRLGSVTFRVVGVLNPKGANMFGSDQDDIIVAPWTTIKYRVSSQSTGGAAHATVQTTSTSSDSISTAVNTLSALYPTTDLELYPELSTVQQADTPLPVRFSNIDQILCSTRGPLDIPIATAQVTSLLHQRHRIEGGPDDFMIRDMTELSRTLTATTTVMSGLLLVVALISLLVGGVGIMNIMLVSVTERTREIGLRMAVGARGRDILRQFLTEAIVLCLLGGAVGILLGRCASEIVRMTLHWSIQASPAAILASVAVSALVGVSFGYYPAWKASRLDPIDALRYE